ncbi:hypothetical protein GENT11_12850 [Flavobacterium ammonificans]|uniref:Uncharacterized protein n=1 Tax=Flavobacterium ammonificans TaxID=1751056 RepID=A0ABM7UZB4_9FLAO|nr:hypothetical protein GENT11_12850 [Flavobacterium ammonificans]
MKNIVSKIKKIILNYLITNSKFTYLLILFVLIIGLITNILFEFSLWSISILGTSLLIATYLLKILKIKL